MEEEKEFNAPWKRQRILKKEDIPHQEEIINKSYTFNDLKEKSLFIMAYLTAGRISEIVQCKYLRKHTYVREEVIDKQGRTIKAVKHNENGSPMIESTERIQIDYKGVCKNHIIFKEINEKPIMLVSLQNRKNKNFIRKSLPIPIAHEPVFVNIIKEYLATLDWDEPLFDFGIAKAERIIAKVDMNPHFLRDIRLTHLVTIYDFNPFHLVQFAGWTNSKPAERYVRLDVKDMVAKF